MKKTLVLVLAASVVTAMLAGCAGEARYGGYPSEAQSFTVDASSATLNAATLDVAMTHSGTLKEGIDGWSFQVYVDADHDPATGIDGAEYFVNGLEGRSTGGYAIRKAQANGAWGMPIGHAGADDGSTLSLPLSRTLIPTSAAYVRLKVYAEHKLVHDQTFDVN